MNPKVLQIISGASTRFQRTSDNSLMEYAKLLFTELKQKAEEAEDKNEAMWYADAACVTLELAIRLQSAQNKIEVLEYRANPKPIDYRERGI